MGANIPLPALGIHPQQGPDVLNEYAKAMSIRGMQQQQQVQGVDLQQKQLALKDQQAMTKAMQDAVAQWDGKDPQALQKSIVDNATKSGASFNAVNGLQQHLLDRQKAMSEIAEKDATTGSKNVETLLKKNDIISGKLGNIANLPDAELPNGIMQTAQELAQSQLIDPQHAQAAQQIAQMAAQDPAGARQKLSILQKSYMAESQQAEMAAKAAAAKKDTSQAAEADARLPLIKAEADLKTTEAANAKQFGGLTGPQLESKYVYLNQQKNLGRNIGADGDAFVKAYEQQKKIVPAFNFNLQNSNSLTDPAMDQAAEKYFQTGQLPPAGRGGAGLAQVRKIMNRAAELHPDGDLAGNAAAFKANSESLKKLQTNFDQVSAFEQTALKNIDLLQETAKKIPDLGTRFANVPVRAISERMIGTDQMAAFKTALNTAQTEAAKVLNSSNASGILSDSARHELQQIVDGNMPYSAMVASLNTLKKDMSNRHEAYSQQISDIQGRLKTKSAPAQGGGSGGEQQPITITLPSGKTVTIK